MRTILRRVSAILLALILLCGLVPVTPAQAASGTMTKSSVYLCGNSEYSKSFSYANGESHTMRTSALHIHYMNGGTVYCVEPHVASEGNTSYTGTDANSTTLWNTKLSKSQRYAIGLILLYGAPNYLTSTDAQTKFGYECATQILIWEIIMGLRNSVKPYTVTDSSLYSYFANGFYWDGSSLASNATAITAYKNAYSTIASKIAAHTTIPSFCAFSPTTAPTITLKYNASNALCTGSATDTNGVLASDYNFTAPGVTFSKNGNTINISVPYNTIKDSTITASATGRSLDDSNIALMIWSRSGSQTVLQLTSKHDPAKAYFKLKSDTLPATLEIYKTSDDGHVAGIAFTVKDSAGKTVASGKTDTNGKLNVSNLLAGQTYTITETVPTNYTAEKQSQTITLKPGKNTVSFVNHLIRGYMGIQKSTDYGTLEGYHFRVWNKDTNTTWCGITDTAGALYQTDSDWERIYNKDGWSIYNLEGLVDGTYSVREVLSLSPGKYTYPDSWRITVTDKSGKVTYDHTFQENELKADENGDYSTPRFTVTGLTGGGKMTMRVHNAPLPSTLEIRKSSEDGKVSGIAFDVEEWVSGIGYCPMGQYTTDAAGKISVPGLHVGTKYRLTEVVPEGYIGEDPKEIVAQEGINTVTFENRPIFGSLELTKVDAEHPDVKLSGAVFEVSYGSQKAVMEEVADEAGVYQLEKIPYGSVCTIRETKAPEGYALSDEVFTVEILEEKTYRVASDGFDAVVNRPIRGNLEILKTDGVSGKPLQGAGFCVFDATGKKVAEGFTDENGKLAFGDLPYGHYTYQEFQAPDGFKLDETVYDFSILENGKTIAVSRQNTPLPGSIRIKKVDPEGKPLEGVIFLLEFSSDGKTYHPVREREDSDPIEVGSCTSKGLKNGRLATDANGIAHFTGLAIDSQLGQVFYRLTEVETQDGYQLLTTPAFEGTLAVDTEIDVELTVVNSPGYELPKTGSSGFPLVPLGVCAVGLTAVGIVMLERKKKSND